MMTRPTLAILAACSMAVGCAADRPRPVVERPILPPSAPVATALAFTPPVAVAWDDLNLDRIGRGPSADAGYEAEVFSETFVYQDDRQRFVSRGRDFGQFERRAVSVTVRRR